MVKKWIPKSLDGQGYFVSFVNIMSSWKEKE